jgi:hypothetical protein
MYSILINIILKRLKFWVAGTLLITILPGNAGENYDNRKTDLNGLNSSNQSAEFISPVEIFKLPGSSSNNITEKASSLQAFSVSKQNCKEISPTGKSFNFYMNIQ